MWTAGDHHLGLISKFAGWLCWFFLLLLLLNAFFSLTLHCEKFWGSWCLVFGGFSPVFETRLDGSLLCFGAAALLTFLESIYDELQLFLQIAGTLFGRALHLLLCIEADPQKCLWTMGPHQILVSSSHLSSLLLNTFKILSLHTIKIAGTTKPDFMKSESIF